MKSNDTTATRKRWLPVATSLAVLHLAGLGGLQVAAGEPRLSREWYRAGFGAGIGAAGLHAVDLEGDGPLEIVAAAGPSGFLPDDHWYVLSRDGAGYSQSWVSPRYPSPITGLVVAQLDADSALEVLVATGAQILVYDGAARQLQQTLTTGSSPIRGLKVADVDLDGARELVFSDEDDLFVLDAATGGLRFQGVGLGGRDLAVGNVDGDPAREIVVANGTSAGYVIDGSTHAVEWTNPAGFGDRVRVADLDGDGRDEIVAAFAWAQGIVVYQGGTLAPAYSIPVLDLAAVQVTDVEGDGAPELVYGDGQWGRIHVLAGSTGAEKWSIANPDHGVTDIAVGDVDGDAVAEILWGAGYSSDAPDHLYVADAATRALEWRSPEFAGPFHGLEVADVDGDGALELIYGASPAEGGYAVFFGHDAVTKDPEFQLQNPGPTGLWRVRSADVDDDPQREVFITTGGPSGGAVICYDGLTREEQWRTDLGSGHTFASLQVADLDGDGRLELVAGAKVEHSGAPGAYVYAYDAATGAPRWRSPLLKEGFATLSLLRLADVSGDSRLEVLVADWGGRLFMLDAAGQAVPLATDGLEISALDTPDRDRDGKAEIVVGTTTGALLVLDPMTGAVVETAGAFGTAIHGLAVADVDTDGTPDYVFVRDDRLRVVYAPGGPEVELGELLGPGAAAHDSLRVRDIGGGFRLELIVNAGALGLMVFQTDRYEPYPVITSPSPGSTVSGPIPVSAHAADDLAVSRVEFYVDDALLGTDYTAPYGLVWDTTPYAGSAPTLVAKAYDTAGHAGAGAPVSVWVRGDTTPPAVTITSPAAGATVGAMVSVTASALDDFGVTRVDFYVDGVLKGSDGSAPYEFAWDTTRHAEGSHALVAAAVDPSGNVGTSAPVAVTVENPGGERRAVYDPGLRAPRCAGVGSACDSGSLLNGRGTVGPEGNAPNTINRSCADGSAGTYHSDESNDRIRVATLDGTPFARGKTVRVEATAWAWAGYTSDKLDLYRAADANAPVWTLIATLTPRAAGSQLLTATYVLPAGTLQAVRARFRYGGAAAPCGAGVFNDHDDLVFGVQ